VRASVATSMCCARPCAFSSTPDFDEWHDEYQREEEKTLNTWDIGRDQCSADCKSGRLYATVQERATQDVKSRN